MSWSDVKVAPRSVFILCHWRMRDLWPTELSWSPVRFSCRNQSLWLVLFRFWSPGDGPGDCPGDGPGDGGLFISFVLDKAGRFVNDQQSNEWQKILINQNINRGTSSYFPHRTSTYYRGTFDVTAEAEVEKKIKSKPNIFTSALVFSFLAEILSLSMLSLMTVLCLTHTEGLFILKIMSIVTQA